MKAYEELVMEWVEDICTFFMSEPWSLDTDRTAISLRIRVDQ